MLKLAVQYVNWKNKKQVNDVRQKDCRTRIMTPWAWVEILLSAKQCHYRISQVQTSFGA